MRAALWLLPPFLAVPAAAQPVLVRVGSHGHFGRVVFEFARPQTFSLERSGSAVTLRFPDGGEVPDGSGAAHNIAAVTGGGGMATLTVSPAARIRAVTMGNRVVVDVLDQISAKAAANPTGVPSDPRRSGPSAFHDRDEPPAMLAAAPALPATEPTKSGTPSAPPIPPAPAAGVSVPTTLALAASQATPAPGVMEPGLLLPFDTSVGAAAFRRGEEAWLLFDERRPLDLRVLTGDPVFANATVELLPAATLVRLGLPSHRHIRLERLGEGWLVQAVDEETAGQALMPVITSSRLLFPAAGPSQVVAVPEPATGRNLLVGTLRASGPGVPATIRAPEFTVVPSWQGIVIEPVSDRTGMRAVSQGFSVETGGALSPSLETAPTLASAAVLTRRFDFPNDSVTTLLRRLQSQSQDEGQAPAQSRLDLRKATAQTMLALGLGVEAQSLLRVALAEDPRAAADPDLSGLAGIAALVSGRPAEAGGLDAVTLSATDDVTLWRAVRAALLNEGSPDAAQAFSATLGLVLSYPKALQSRLLPIAAETMVAGGASRAADALLTRLPDEPLLAFARAERMQQKGETEAALTLYDALENGRDRLASARAATRAVLLRLATGRIEVGEAADRLERSLDSWRGGARERNLRLQTADIQALAGRWRDALRTLRDTVPLFADETPVINAHIADLFASMLHGNGAAAIKPLEFVTLAEENADVVAASNLPELTSLLADKLTALDLPDRAGPVLDRMIRAAPQGLSRAILGARLAAMRLGAGDIAGSAAALAGTESPDLPPGLAEERGLLQARIAAAGHDVAGATAILTQIGTMAADELRAATLGDNGDWWGAAQALSRVAAQTIPDAGALTPQQQDLLLRLASAESRAGQQEALTRLERDHGSRMVGARAGMFRLLTSAPVTSASGLHRSSQDLAMLRDLPAAITAVGR